MPGPGADCTREGTDSLSSAQSGPAIHHTTSSPHRQTSSKQTMEQATHPAQFASTDLGVEWCASYPAASGGTVPPRYPTTSVFLPRREDPVSVRVVAGRRCRCGDRGGLLPWAETAGRNLNVVQDCLVVLWVPGSSAKVRAVERRVVGSGWTGRCGGAGLEQHEAKQWRRSNPMDGAELVVWVAGPDPTDRARSNHRVGLQLAMPDAVR